MREADFFMDFKNGAWTAEVNVRDFIQNNYTPYDGDRDFLAPPTERTLELWRILSERMKLERERNGVYHFDHHLARGRLHRPGA